MQLGCEPADMMNLQLIEWRVLRKSYQYRNITCVVFTGKRRQAPFRCKMGEVGRDKFRAVSEHHTGWLGLPMPSSKRAREALTSSLSRVR